MRQYLRQYFIFTPNERKAVIALTVLIFIIAIIPNIYHHVRPAETVEIDYELEKQIAAFKQEYNARLIADSLKEESGFVYEKKKSKMSYELFDFDPNKIGAADWMKLGLSEKQSKVIENYKLKGGKFKKPEDILKIFVLNDEKKQELLPHVKIDHVAFAQIEDKQDPFKTKDYKPRTFERIVVDINTADSAQFERLRGIGQKLAPRIVKYRERLGGFYSIDQVSEVYALPDSTFQKIKPNLTISKIELRKLNINTAQYEDFHAHPYTRKIAGLILKYRKNNSQFQTREQICRVPEMTDSICKKLLPYIVIE